MSDGTKKELDIIAERESRYAAAQRRWNLRAWYKRWLGIGGEKELDNQGGNGAVASDSDATQDEKALETVKDSSAECAICGGKCLET